MWSCYVTEKLSIKNSYFPYCNIVQNVHNVMLLLLELSVELMESHMDEEAGIDVVHVLLFSHCCLGQDSYICS